MTKNILHFLLQPAPEPFSIIKMDELCRLFGCSRMTIYRWMAQQKLPLPLRHDSGRLIGWNRQDIDRMLRHR